MVNYITGPLPVYYMWYIPRKCPALSTEEKSFAPTLHCSQIGTPSTEHFYPSDLKRCLKYDRDLPIRDEIHLLTILSKKNMHWFTWYNTVGSVMRFGKFWDFQTDSEAKALPRKFKYLRPFPPRYPFNGQIISILLFLYIQCKQAVFYHLGLQSHLRIKSSWTESWEDGSVGRHLLWAHYFR